MAEWTIKRANDDVETFTAASIVDARLTRRNQSADICEISFGFGNLKQADPWEANEQITIRRDGVRWFKGRNIGMRPGATGGTVSSIVTLAGVWWWLENIVFTRSAKFVSDPDANPTPAGASLVIGDFETETKTTSIIFLGETTSGVKIASDEMITKALEFAIAAGAPFQIGTIDAGVDIPRQELRAVTCADIIRAALQWTPGHATWVDYSTTPPTFHARKRSNRTLVTIAITDEEVEEVSLQKRRDLVLSGVRVEYLRIHERENFRFRTLDFDEVGTADGVRGLILPIELYGSYLAGTFLVEAEAIPTGVAQSIYEAYDTAPYDGIVRLAQAEIDDIPWTGKTLAVTGAQPDWEDMRADIQGSTESTATGRTELAIGPPNHLGPQDLIALLRNGSNRGPGAVDSVTLHNGGSPAANNPVPADTIDPKLLFGPLDPPDAVIYVRLVPSGGPAWLYGAGSEDTATVKDEPGGTTLGTVSASSIPGPGVGTQSTGPDGMEIAGGIVTVGGVRIGRIDKYYGPSGAPYPGGTPSAVAHEFYAADYPD